MRDSSWLNCLHRPSSKSQRHISRICFSKKPPCIFLAICLRRRITRQNVPAPIELPAYCRAHRIRVAMLFWNFLIVPHTSTTSKIDKWIICVARAVIDCCKRIIVGCRRVHAPTYTLAASTPKEPVKDPNPRSTTKELVERCPWVYPQCPQK